MIAPCLTYFSVFIQFDFVIVYQVSFTYFRYYEIVMIYIYTPSNGSKFSLYLKTLVSLKGEGGRGRGTPVFFLWYGYGPRVLNRVYIFTIWRLEQRGVFLD